MKTVFKTIAVQVVLAAVAVGAYGAYDLDRAIHQARLVGLAAKTIFAPRGKTAESDHHVAVTGRARLAQQVLGDWGLVPDLEIVYEEVLGAEWYKAVYRDPDTGELKRYSTTVRWLEMGERYPYNPPAMTDQGLLDAVAAGTTVVTDNRDVSDSEEIN